MKKRIVYPINTIDKDQQDFLDKSITHCELVHTSELLDHEIFNYLHTRTKLDIKYSNVLARIDNFSKKDKIVNFLAVFSGAIDNITYLNEIRSMFGDIDVNNDGFVDQDELLVAFTSQFHDEKRAKARVDAIFLEIDIDNNKKLDFNEFLIVSYKTDKKCLNKLKSRFEELQNVFDKDGSKSLSFEEFSKTLGLDITVNSLFIKELHETYTLLDKNGDNTVDIDEFRCILDLVDNDE